MHAIRAELTLCLPLLYEKAFMSFAVCNIMYILTFYLKTVYQYLQDFKSSLLEHYAMEMTETFTATNSNRSTMSMPMLRFEKQSFIYNSNTC